MNDPGRDYLLCIIPCIALIRYLSPTIPIYIIDYTNSKLAWNKYQYLNFNLVKISKSDSNFKSKEYPILFRPYEMERFIDISNNDHILYIDLDQMFLKSPETLPRNERLNICRTNGGMIYFDRQSSIAIQGIKTLQTITSKAMSNPELKKSILDYYVENGYRRYFLDESVNLYSIDHNLNDIRNFWKNINKSVCLNDYSNEDILKNINDCWSVHLHSGSLPQNSVRVRGLSFFFLKETHTRLKKVLGRDLYRMFPEEWEEHPKFELCDLQVCFNFIVRFLSKYEFGWKFPILI